MEKTQKVKCGSKAKKKLWKGHKYWGSAGALRLTPKDVSKVISEKTGGG